MKNLKKLFQILILSTMSLGVIKASEHSNKEELLKQEEKYQSIYRAYFEDRDHAYKAMFRFDALSVNYQQGYFIVNLDDKVHQELLQMGFILEEEKEWFQQNITSKFLNNNTQQQAVSGYPCYQTVEETFAEAAQIANNNPDFAQWIDIGNSWEKNAGLGGNDLMVLKLTNSAIGGNKPKLFINSAIHAREYATAPLVLQFAKDLINGYGIDADSTWVLDHHEVHLLLQSNPDGRKKAEAGVLWRKNTNQNYCGSTSGNRGADLNRNFSYTWNSTSNGSSGNQCSATYRGPYAASEPETAAIENYVKSLWPDRRGSSKSSPAPADTSGIHLDIHSYGNLIIYPYGQNSVPAPNEAQLRRLARKLAFGNGYDPIRGTQLYETDGTTDAISYGELGVAALTIEVGTQFFQSCNYFNNTIIPDVMPSLLYAARVARLPYITPLGPDVLSLTLSDNASMPQGVQAGTTVSLTLALNDNQYSSRRGTEPSQAIRSGEYYIDIPPWKSGASAEVLSVSDGTFNSTTENMIADINTSGMSQGQHILFIRGQDADNNWGEVRAIFLYINSSNGNLSPTAAFSENCTELSCDFDASASSDPDGSIVSYSWSFGDGSSDSGVNPAHRYNSDGSYTVSLTVTDNEGATKTTSHIVRIGDPVDDKLLTDDDYRTVATLPKDEWLHYYFDNDGSYSEFTVMTAANNGDLDLYVLFEAEPNTATYDCKDDSPDSNESCTISNLQRGRYHIGVKAWSATDNLTMNLHAEGVPSDNTPPTASFTDNCSDLVCNFDSSDSSDPDGDIASYSWSFGNGSSSNSSNPSHTYHTAGNYTVTLTVTDNDGATDSSALTISVTGGDPSGNCSGVSPWSSSANYSQGDNVTHNGLLYMKNFWFGNSEPGTGGAFSKWDNLGVCN